MDGQKAKLVPHIRALISAGNWPLAEAKLADALKAYPTDPVFLEFMGVTKLNLKNPKDAARTFKKLLKRAPKQATTYLNLASAEIMLGALPKAQANVMKALKLAPRAADAWMLQGDIHIERGHDEKAIESYTTASRLQPDSLKFAVKLLTALEGQNNPADLERHVEFFEKSALDQPVIKLFRGVIHVRNSEFLAAKEILESFDFSAGKQAQFGNFELMRLRNLGLVSDKLQHEAEAVSYFSRAKALNRALHQNPAPPEMFWQICEMRAAYFKTDAAKHWQPPAPHTDEPVFVIGFPRSGTTLLDTFLRGHKSLTLLEEVPTVSKMRTALGTSADHDIATLGTLDEKGLSAAKKAYFDEMQHYRPKGVVIDKLPMNLAFAGEILRVFPRAKFILALRDPADAVLSCFMQTFRLNPPMATLDSPKDAAKTYALTMQIWQNTVQTLAPTFITSRYEDLISDPEGTLRPIISFLNLDWDDALLDHQATAQSRSVIKTPSRTQVVQPLYQSSVARWARYEALMPEALEILAPWRKEFGYSD